MNVTEILSTLKTLTDAVQALQEPAIAEPVQCSGGTTPPPSFQAGGLLDLVEIKKRRRKAAKRQLTHIVINLNLVLLAMDELIVPHLLNEFGNDPDDEWSDVGMLAKLLPHMRYQIHQIHNDVSGFMPGDAVARAQRGG